MSTNNDKKGWGDLTDDFFKKFAPYQTEEAKSIGIITTEQAIQIFNFFMPKLASAYERGVKDGYVKFLEAVIKELEKRTGKLEDGVKDILSTLNAMK